VCLAQEGKQRFLKERAAAMAALLKRGVAVCLVDVRGSGELRPGDRGRQSSATGLSSTEQMLGQTMLGGCVEDVSALLLHLAESGKVDGSRVALWGESFAPANKADADLGVPRELDQPSQAEPMGPLVALLAGLSPDRVKAVVARGGLVSYRSLLDSPFLHLPHDAVVPGALTVSDLSDVAAALAPKALRIEGAVDGLNRRVSADTLSKEYAAAQKCYADARAKDALQTATEYSSDDKLAEWFAEALRR
jgi:hypothetical protein